MKSIELFAGAGGLSLGLERAGFNPVFVTDINKDASNTLKYNRPDWNVICDDIKSIHFNHSEIDLLSGGFPCQTFSYAGNRLGFDDPRGKLFYEFRRAITEVSPKVFLMENVKGLLNHNNGNTLNDIMKSLSPLGYKIYYKLLNAVFYDVPQIRERLFIVGVRDDITHEFMFPELSNNSYTVNDILNISELYPNPLINDNVPAYSEAKLKYFDKIPEGGYWRHLPQNLIDELRGNYISFDKNGKSRGGQTGILRKLSRYEPSLTILCSPEQRRTERCHPTELRPLTIRESARIQTFPDEWVFKGSITSQYKQVGNAVPVNLAYHIGKQIHHLLSI